MPRRSYLPGASVVGFYGLFEADFGDPETPKPYARVTPSRIASAVLPFHCPRCQAGIDFTDRERREQFHDKRKGSTGHHWCPTCSARFQINMPGKAVSSVTLDSSGCAPSIIEQAVKDGDGLVEVKRRETGRDAPQDAYLAGTDVLGAEHAASHPEARQRASKDAWRSALSQGFRFPVRLPGAPMPDWMKPANARHGSKPSR